MTSPATPTTTQPVVPPDHGALAWIDHHTAVVTRLTAAGDPTMEDFAFLDDDPEARASVIARIVHAVTDCRRLTVVGDDDMRTLLEREYVALLHRPDRLFEIEAAGPIDRADLGARLRGLA